MWDTREVPAGKPGVGLGVGGCKEDHGLIRWLFCPMFINAFTQWMALYCIYIMK